ncbi:MAG: pantoate--beta-alanine ligase [Candidatus Solibacter usitatus]|nr:pantoate--beta-alanine ligase [Candidatus Solibacter usitatus]
MPEIVSQTGRLRELLQTPRAAGASIGFVPTMGALHAGHARLLEVARRQNQFLAASIFVNPLQFDRPEDLDTYPRTWEQDLRLCRDCGVDLIFAPTPELLYPRQQLTFVESPSLAAHLCGRFRPGHFRGVATVVLKLLNLVQPNRAYFGRKDAQQLAIIRRMALDLDLPVEIVPVPTVREPDGLALSSRNLRLTPPQRVLAPLLYRSLRAAAEAIDAGETSVPVIRQRALAVLSPCPAESVEYFEIVDPETLVPLDRVAAPVLIAAALWLGATRLIDNLSWPATSD